MRPHTRRHTRSHRPRPSDRVARWRTSESGRGGRETEPVLRPALFVFLVLASGYGRGLRMVAGGLLIGLGAAVGGGFLTTIVAATGLAAILEAMYDLCLVAPLLGCPSDGAQIRKQAALTL